MQENMKKGRKNRDGEKRGKRISSVHQGKKKGKETKGKVLKGWRKKRNKGEGGKVVEKGHREQGKGAKEKKSKGMSTGPRKS